MDCICSDYTALSLVKIITTEMGDWLRGHLSADCGVLIQRKAMQEITLFQTAFHRLINVLVLCADGAFDNGPLKQKTSLNQTFDHEWNRNRRKGKKEQEREMEKDRDWRDRWRQRGKGKGEDEGPLLEDEESAPVGIRWTSQGKWLLCDTRHVLIFISPQAHTHTHTYPCW